MQSFLEEIPTEKVEKYQIEMKLNFFVQNLVRENAADI